MQKKNIHTRRTKWIAETAEMVTKIHNSTWRARGRASQSCNSTWQRCHNTEKTKSLKTRQSDHVMYYSKQTLQFPGKNLDLKNSSKWSGYVLNSKQTWQFPGKKSRFEKLVKMIRSYTKIKTYIANSRKKRKLEFTWRFFFLWKTIDLAFTFLSLMSTLFPVRTMGIFSQTRTKSLCQLGTFL